MIVAVVVVIIIISHVHCDVFRLSLKMEPPASFGDDSSDGDEPTVKSCLPLAHSPPQQTRVEGSTPATVGRRASSIGFVPHHRKTRSLAPEYVKDICVS